jgi:glutamine amidotransferase
MSDSAAPAIVIVDYGMGNLFSVLRACQSVGVEAVITDSKQAVSDAAAVILPGVGAFGVAMENLAALDLIDVLRDVAATGKPLLGVCLGMQLLMSESHEFGHHRGLDIIPGNVVQLPLIHGLGAASKVPHVGWESVEPPVSSREGHAPGSAWDGTLLEGLPGGEYMYFVHSFYCRPRDQARVLSVTRYGTFEFCSAVTLGNVMGCQFHPERSGPAGLLIYRNFSAKVASLKQGEQRAGQA